MWRRNLSTLRRSLPVLGLLTPMVLLVVLPMGVLIMTSFLDSPPRPGSPLGSLTLENYRELLSAGTRVATTGTMLVAVFGTLLALLIGVPLAWLVTRTDVPFRGLLQLAGFVPLFMSSLVGALAWALIASPNAGYLNHLLGALGLPEVVNIYSMPGIVFVFGLYYAPYSFIFVSGALTLMNPELEESAAVHGGSRRAIVRRVTAPLATPAILASALLTFVLIAENFPVVQVLGLPASVSTLPVRIFRLLLVSPPNPNQAAAIGVLLMLIVFAGVFLQTRLLKRRSFVTVTGKGFRPRRVSLGRYRWVGFGFGMTYMFIAVVMPLFALVQSSLRQHQFLADFGDLFDTSAFGTQNISETLNHEAFRQSLWNSLLVATGTAALGGLLFFMAAFVVHRSTAPGRQLLSYVSVMPLAMPALVIGMGFLWTWTRSPVPIYGTLFIMMFAFITRFMPQGFQGVSSTLVQLDKDLEESAYTLGASRVRTARLITLPLVKSGVASTMFLVLILSFRELSAALLLFTTDTRMLSIVIYEQWENGRWPLVATMSLAFSAILCLIAIVGRRFFGMGKA